MVFLKKKMNTIKVDYQGLNFIIGLLALTLCKFESKVQICIKLLKER
jgi:hypothetical protein